VLDMEQGSGGGAPSGGGDLPPVKLLQAAADMEQGTEREGEAGALAETAAADGAGRLGGGGRGRRRRTGPGSWSNPSREQGGAGVGNGSGANAAEGRGIPFRFVLLYAVAFFRKKL
jgi:hypothetical protein